MHNPKLKPTIEYFESECVPEIDSDGKEIEGFYITINGRRVLTFNPKWREQWQKCFELVPFEVTQEEMMGYSLELMRNRKSRFFDIY